MLKARGWGKQNQLKLKKKKQHLIRNQNPDKKNVPGKARVSKMRGSEDRVNPDALRCFSIPQGNGRGGE